MFSGYGIIKENCLHVRCGPGAGADVGDDEIRKRMMQGRSMCEVLKVRHNVTDVSSINAFADRRGGSDRRCKDVCFIRMLGMDAGYADAVREMDRLLSAQAAEGTVRYQRISGLPRLAASEDVEYYSGCCEKWTAAGRKLLELHVSEENEALKAALAYACGETLRFFGQVTPGVSASMEKNYAVKLMFWTDQVGKELLQGYDPERIMKFVAPELSRKQEYLFAYFLTLLGVDVLLLQHQSDIDGKLEGLKLSKKVQLGAFGPCSFPVYQPYAPGPLVPPHSERKNGQPAVARVRRPLEVRLAGEAGTGRTASAGGSRGSGASGSVRTAPPAGYPRRTVTAGGNPGRTAPGGSRGHTAPGAGGSASGAYGPGNASRRELDFEELARLASSVVMISVHDRKGEVLGNGSGIMIGEGGYILTNHHVASGGRCYSVRIEDDNIIYKTDEIIKYNSVLDLAVIRIDRRLKPLPIYRGGRKLVRGQKVVAIGSPLGLFNSVSDGIISGFRVINDVDMIQFTAPISHGSSGGAVLNMYGEVIGISTAGFDNGQNINLAVGYEFIGQFVSGFTGQHGK